MQNKVLSEDLDNCLIDFDSRVVVSDLLNEYGGQLLEISELLKNAVLKEEENGRKFKKTFMIHGFVDDFENEVISIVDETEIPSLDEKIKITEKYLYCTEPHGAKLFPWVFKPVKYPTIRLKNIQRAEPSHSRDDPQNVPTNGKTIEKKVEPTESREIDKPNKSENNEGEKKSINNTTKISPKSAKERKPLQKQSIQNFFSVGDGKTKPAVKKEVVKKAPSDFFKKQEQKPKQISQSASTPPKPTVVKNDSIMVIDESSSSDDEEAREALKRELQSDDDEVISENPNVKRRRIVESDDEDEDVAPVVKDEKIDDEEENIKPVEIKTFQDDDGFMITVKDKIKKKTPPRKVPQQKTPKKKSPPFGKLERKSTKKEPPKSSMKTRQGSITSFFSKK